MSKMLKPKSLLLLMFALVMAFTTACSSGGDNKNASEKEGEQSPPAEEVKLTQDDPGWKVDTSPITFDWYINFAWFPNKWGEDITSQYVTEKTGVNINFIVPAGNETEKMNTMIASGTLPDFITLDWNNDAVKKMIEGELVLPLNELAEQYDPYFFKVTDPGRYRGIRRTTATSTAIRTRPLRRRITRSSATTSRPTRHSSCARICTRRSASRICARLKVS